MQYIRIPKRFYDDHVDRDLPAPPIVRETKKHYWVSPDSIHLEELWDDAHHYSDCAGPGWSFDGALGLQSSARATARAIREALA